MSQKFTSVKKLDEAGKPVNVLINQDLGDSITNDEINIQDNEDVPQINIKRTN